MIFRHREEENLSWEKAGRLPFPIASGPQVGVGACDVSSEDDISFEEEWINGYNRFVSSRHPA